MNRVRALLAAPFAIIVLLFLGWPATRDFALTFTDFDPLRPQVLNWVGFEHYARALSNQQLWVAAGNLAFFVPVSVTLELVLGLLLALALREPFRGRHVMRAVLLAPWLVNPVAAGVMARFLAGAVGPLTWLAAVIGLPAPDLRASGVALPSLVALEVWRNAPLVTFLLLPSLESIPASRWDLTRIEGLSFVQAIRHTVLPAMRPVLLVISLLLLANAISGFEAVLMFTGGGPGSQTLLPGLLAYQAGYKTFDWATGSSLSWLIALGVLTVGWAYQWLLSQTGEL